MSAFQEASFFSGTVSGAKTKNTQKKHRDQTNIIEIFGRSVYRPLNHSRSPQGFSTQARAARAPT
jgi:hypothetical protein